MLKPSLLPATAVIYVRVSSADQVAGTSLDTQERACREFCARNGWSVAEVYREEGESAKTTDRTELQRILARLKRKGHGIGRLVVYDFSRFARSAYDHMGLTQTLGLAGVRLVSVTQPIENDSNGRLMEQLLASFAEHQNAQLRERTTLGMREAFARGIWPWQAPLGYVQRRGADKRATMEQDPVTAPVIRRAFERMASGSVTQQDVRAEMQRAGLSMTRETLSRVLRNPLYCGRMVAKQWGAETKGAFVPIVTEEIFDRVQGVLSREVSGWRRSEHAPEFPLRNWTRCTTHDAPLTAYLARGRNGTRYPYYRCTARPACMNVRAGAVDAAFVGLLSRCALSPGLCRAFEAVLRDVASRRDEEARQQRRAAELRVATAKARVDRLLAALTDGVLPRETFGEQHPRLAADLQAARTALADIPPGSGLEPAIRAGLELLETPVDLWNTVLPRDRHRLVRIAFPSNLYYDREDGFRTPFRSLFLLPPAIFRDSRERWYPDGDRPRTGAEVIDALSSYGQLAQLERVPCIQQLPH